MSTRNPSPSTPARCVILRVNIGEDHHHWVSEDDARKLAATPDPILVSLERDFDRQTFSPRQWRALARDLNKLVEDARNAAPGPARYIVTGRAPLPVFAYLGASMVRFGEITVANDFNGKWETFGPPEVTESVAGTDDFTAVPPSLGRVRKGRLALSIQCSAEYQSPDDSVAELLGAEGLDFLGTYTIHKAMSHKIHPLVETDLPKILSHVESALTWFSKEAPNRDSLIVPLAGPNWMAFWVGHRLNPTVCGRIDFPNYVPGLGYRRALSYPMNKAPWLTDKATVLVMQAEPKSLNRIEGGRSFDAVQDAFEREVGREGPLEVRFRGAATIREFMRDIELTKPDILHLHLHGTTASELVFEDQRGERANFPIDNFVARLRATKIEPTLIVLHACHAEDMAPSLVGIAECVVNMKGLVSTVHATEFSRCLYEAIGRGNDLDTAIAQAKASVPNVEVEVHPVGNIRTTEIVLMPRPRS